MEIEDIIKVRNSHHHTQKMRMMKRMMKKTKKKNLNSVVSLEEMDMDNTKDMERDIMAVNITERNKMMRKKILEEVQELELEETMMDIITRSMHQEKLDLRNFSEFCMLSSTSHSLEVTSTSSRDSITLKRSTRNSLVRRMSPRDGAVAGRSATKLPLLSNSSQSSKSLL